MLNLIKPWKEGETTVKLKSSQFQPPGLYLVATPIGNLQDITLRALDILQLADLVVCEDTRVTGNLLAHYGIKKSMFSYHDHNGEERRPKILQALEEGKRVALVSDAGTPLISDPGYKLVRAAQTAGHYVTAIPGASSVLTGLLLSGLPTDRFLFAGFLPAKKEAARKTIRELALIPSTLVIFEAARRLPETLVLLAEELGDREAAVTRELTKRFEESQRGVLSGLAMHYDQEGAPKGEVVIVIAPPDKNVVMDIDVEGELKKLLIDHGVKEASSLLAEKTGLKSKELYALAVKIKDARE
jgi:16S rRNA (cytidine1402-2'-O)-methyltransferase